MCALSVVGGLRFNYEYVEAIFMNLRREVQEMFLGYLALNGHNWHALYVSFDFELKSLRSMTAILVSYFEFFFLFWRFGLPLFLMLSFYSNVLSPLLARKVYLLLAGGEFFFLLLSPLLARKVYLLLAGGSSSLLLPSAGKEVYPLLAEGGGASAGCAVKPPPM